MLDFQELLRAPQPSHRGSDRLWFDRCRNFRNRLGALRKAERSSFTSVSYALRMKIIGGRPALSRAGYDFRLSLFLLCSLQMTTFYQCVKKPQEPFG
jgi:hypothetical protein